MSADSHRRLRLALRLGLMAVYGPVGVTHVVAPRVFAPMTPPWVPKPKAVLIATGACEIAGVVGLLFPSTRKAGAIGLALYAVGVYPANVYHAVSKVDVPPIPNSWWYHAPRLLFQPVFVWWALFAGGVIDWPSRRTLSARR